MHWLFRWLPENVSTYGAEIDGLFRLIYWITCVTFLLVMGLMVLFLVIYRQREGRKAVYSHGNTTLELIWTVVPALILVWLTFKSEAVWERVRGPTPPGDVHVVVAGKQYNWYSYYPGPDGKLDYHGTEGASDDLGVIVPIVNQLDVPVNKVIRVSVQSKDVIHSFFLPNFRMKQDAVPGRSIEVWFQATKPGKYEIACAELCGMDHAGMRGTLVVHDDASWAAWVKEHPNAFPAPALKTAMRKSEATP
jgi:cytochrome c oxidase subunit 2